MPKVKTKYVQNLYNFFVGSITDNLLGLEIVNLTSRRRKDISSL